jgi:CRP-like cAMP-binding protein
VVQNIPFFLSLICGNSVVIRKQLFTFICQTQNGAHEAFMTNSRSPGRIIPSAFPGITPTEVDELISISVINNYPRGTILCRENNVEQTFYMILEGEAEVSKMVNKTESRLLKTLGPGDFFGEMALIHNAPRAATVVAKSSMMVLELNKEGFDRVLHHSSSVAMAMTCSVESVLGCQ